MYPLDNYKDVVVCTENIHEVKKLLNHAVNIHDLQGKGCIRMNTLASNKYIVHPQHNKWNKFVVMY